MANCELSGLWPDDIYVVCGTGQPIQPGDVSSTFATMAGWKVRIFRGGAPLWFEDPSDGSPYFQYASLTGEVTWSSLPVDGEEFIIQAYKPA